MDQLADLSTEFEPAGRASRDVLLEQFGKLSSDVMMKSVADSARAYISVLNAQRQVIFSNAAMVEASGFGSDDVLGMRPGDVFSCENRELGPDGCGTSAICSTCGAAQVLRLARLGSDGENECRIVRDDGEAVDLKVRAFPFSIDGEQCYLFTAIDISDAKRREVLERIFFHDLMNTATGVRGLSSLVRTAAANDREELLEMLERVSDQLIGEIQTQRDLLAAERGELSVTMEEVAVAELLSEVAALYEGHEVARGRAIARSACDPATKLWTDVSLLGRVLGNLVKNALEASGEGETVTISAHVDRTNVVFSVANPAPMPKDVQHQVFHRSFTTKGPGRGLGTYSARLLTERYLRGSISFDSTPQRGTVFEVSLPLVPEGVATG